MLQKDSDRHKLSNTEQRIIETINVNNRITQKKITIKIGMPEGGVRRAMIQLKRYGIISYEKNKLNLKANETISYGLVIYPR